MPNSNYVTIVPSQGGIMWRKPMSKQHKPSQAVVRTSRLVGTEPVDLPTNIVQARHIREIYHLILSTTDKIGCYTNYFCLRQTKPVDIPTNFVHDRKTGRNTNHYCPLQTKPGDIPTSFVHGTQTRDIYQPILFTTDKTGGFTNQYCP